MSAAEVAIWRQKMCAASFGMSALAAPLLCSKGDYIEAAFVALIAFGLWRLAFTTHERTDNG